MSETTPYAHIFILKTTDAKEEVYNLGYKISIS
jgi:hypothetical protein